MMQSSLVFKPPISRTKIDPLRLREPDNLRTFLLSPQCTLRTFLLFTGLVCCGLRAKEIHSQLFSKELVRRIKGTKFLDQAIRTVGDGQTFSCVLGDTIDTVMFVRFLFHSPQDR